MKRWGILRAGIACTVRRMLSTVLVGSPRTRPVDVTLHVDSGTIRRYIDGSGATGRP